MNKRHKNIKFSFEAEKEGVLPFLDVKIFREKGKFVTSVFRKETFSGVYTNYLSFITREYKFGLVYTLLYRCFNLVSDLSKFHHEVNELKRILYKNAYPQKLIDKGIFKFLNNYFVVKPQVATAPKKELSIVLPYLGNLSILVKKDLTRPLTGI